MKKLVLAIMVIAAISCEKKEQFCNCEISRETTLNNKWVHEYTTTRGEVIQGDCNDLDRIDILIQPMIVNTPYGVIMMDGGVREVVDCGQ